jgi:hypothetical protein
MVKSTRRYEIVLQIGDAAIFDCCCISQELLQKQDGVFVKILKDKNHCFSQNQLF